MDVSIKGEEHSTSVQKRTSGHLHIFWSLLHVRAKIGGGLSMSEIWQLSFISSKSRHLSALCVSEIMLGSLANNWDREGTKSHRGGTLIHTESAKLSSGLLHISQGLVFVLNFNLSEKSTFVNLPGDFVMPKFGKNSGLCEDQ